MILNPEDENRLPKFFCNDIVADWLIKKGAVIFSKKENENIFIRTKEFEKIYASMPLYLKIIEKF